MDVDDDNEQPHDHHRLRRLVRTTLLLLLGLTITRVLILEPYAIPTGSMRPTILEGDVMIVNKLPYVIRSLRNIPFTNIAIPHLTLPGLGTLERGDVVVFDFPSESGDAIGRGEQFVKRCVATAGDTVQLVNGRIRVNGIEVPAYGPGTQPGNGTTPGDEPQTITRRAAIDQRRAFVLLRFGGALTVPYTGHTIALDSITAARWSNLIRGEGATVEYRNRIVFIDGLPATYYTFRRDYFFALGDNSADSHDSRYFGFVPTANLIGQAWMIYWSRDSVEGIRWNRFGTVVR